MLETTKTFVDTYEDLRISVADMGRSTAPTESELAILRVLWKLGPSTVRRVHEDLNPRGETAYTTTLKLLQVMHDKGLVKRDASQRSHVYRPSRTAAETQKRLVKHLIDTVFDGSASALAMRALSVRPTPKDELEELRAMLDELEERS